MSANISGEQPCHYHHTYDTADRPNLSKVRDFFMGDMLFEKVGVSPDLHAHAIKFKSNTLMIGRRVEKAFSQRVVCENHHAPVFCSFSASK